MYITCEQCSTIYRLDESRLKPSGSKVRCSECRYVFVATPPEPVVAGVAASGAAVALADQPVQQQDTFDQELEGIDLAELDSILEQGRTSETTTALIDQDDRAEADELVEFNEADLDLDFESALGFEEDTAAELNAGDQAPDLEAEDLDLDLDLDMNFDLDVADDIPVQPPVAEEASLEESFEADLDMEFELDEDIDGSAVAQAAVEDIDTEGDLSEDVEMALDDFEDVLGQPADLEEAGLAPDTVREKEPEPAIDEEAETPGADVEGMAEEVAAEPVGDDSGGFELGDLDALLDEEESEAADELDLEDVELSLDDDAAEAAGEPAGQVMEAGEETEAALTREAGDDLDLSGFEDMLDETDEDLAVADEEHEDVELSLDDDFELSLDEEPAPESAAVPAVSTGDVDEAGDDLDLAGLDDLLTEEDEPAGDTPAEELELSLDDDLDLSLDEEAPALDLESDVAAVDTADEAGDDLDLAGLDDLLAEEDEPAGEAPAEDLELSLDDDLELSLDEEAPAPALEDDGGDARVEVDRDEFDLSNFEDLLDEDAAPAGEDDVLDLSGLDEDMEEQEPVKEGAEESLEMELDDEISLSLDEEPSLDLVGADAPEETVAEGDQDDFDLSGFGDDLLDDLQDDSKEAPSDDLELTLDDDMELSLDDITETEAAADTGAEDDFGELEDLDFEIDAEFEDKPVSKTSEALEADESKPTDMEDGEIDLTDIEKMLEDDTIVPETAAATTDFELDLDGGGAEKWADEEGEDLGLGGEDEIDLTELEEAIESADTDAKAAEPIDAGEELELDMDLEPEEPESADEPEELVLEMEDESPLEMALEDEESDDLDLSDFDLTMEEKPTGQTDTIDAGDIQLEFQVEDHGPIEPKGGLEGDETIEASATTAASAETTDFFIDEEDFSAEETITTEPIQERPKVKAAPAPKKKGGGKILVFILILALLGAGGYYGYNYVIKNNIVIPYLSDYINPEAKDLRGINNLSTLDINSMFIDNQSAGRLFVVKGKVRNGYTNTRKMIRLRGKLYTKGKVPAKTEYVYAGLVVPEQELSSIPISEIKKHLVQTAGQAEAITATAGRSLPFMVVFNNLPADLDEFEIELVSSVKAQ